MWVTFIFAFSDKVNTIVVEARALLRLQEPENNLEYDALGKPKDWVHWASDGLVYSGTLFIGEIVYDTATDQLGLATGGRGILFLGGVSFLLWGMVNAYRVGELVLNPSRLPTTSARSLAVRGADFVLLSGIEAFNIVLLVQSIPDFFRTSIGLQIFAGTILLGAIGFVFLIGSLSKRREATLRGSWPMVLFFLPWIYLTLWSVHPF